MRVLASVPLYPPASRVGAWLSTHECLAHLVGQGHEVDVVLQLSCLPGYALDGVQVHGAQSAVPALAEKADVILSHLGDQQQGALLAVKYDRPSVRMVHGSTKMAAGLLAQFPPSLVVFNSQASAAEVSWSGPQVVVHPPVHAAQYRTTPGDRVTLVNLSLSKGGGLFDLLARVLPEVSFLGVQGGYGTQTHRTLPNVEHISSTQDMRQDVYSRTRVLLMPSVAETWGRVGVEAMCSGIPVIAHPTPGLLESLGQAGIFVDAGDLGAWRQAILQLGDPDVWGHWSRLALARAAELDPAPQLAVFEQALLEVI